MSSVFAFLIGNRLPLMLIGGALLIGGAYIKGRMDCSDVNARRVLEKALTYVDIEREQNEESSRIISDPDLDDILRSGRY